MLPTIEAVPPGTTFKFSITIRVFSGDESALPKWMGLLAQALDDLEHDCLGGCGTRGYGKVRLLTPEGGSLVEHVRALAAPAKK
jgi:CRISPR/Cas system CSM-associated protein Csm3 (group 7 of RAMP superfamily)